MIFSPILHLRKFKLSRLCGILLKYNINKGVITISAISIADATAVLKKGGGRYLKAGGAWIFDNEIDSVRGSFNDGDIISVEDFDGFPMGKGFINSHSKIRVRMLTRDRTATLDEDFFEARVREAWEYRKKVMPDASSCRVIFSEADRLPGLVVDKYEDVLVVEADALGIKRLLPVILMKLLKVLEADGIIIRGIYERSDAPVVRKEGMEPTTGFIGEPFDTKVPISENGVKYIVDVAEGQKTGFFLDQKLNRAAVARLANGAEVLDCFTHTGSFGLNAAMGGAKHVTSVDISDKALAQARENAALNGFSDRIDYVEADVMDYLTRLQAEGKSYDLVILDPPAFTKSRDAVKSATKGYRKLNTEGLKLVRDGGILATCSCSHFMNPALFTKTLKEAAHAAGKRIRQIEFRTQAPDHPFLWAADESLYLKFLILEVRPWQQY